MLAAHRVLSCFSISIEPQRRAICDGNERNSTVGRGIDAVRVHAAAGKAAGDAMVTCRIRTTNGGFRRYQRLFFELDARELGSHLVVHGQSGEIYALEAKSRSFEQLFFLATIYSSPRSLR